jgi:hypothetical protein
MAKYSRTWNENVYRRYIREGRGQGTGADYKPWLTVRDFPSLGVVSRVKGHTTGRVYHLMSTNETNLFYCLDWSDNVLDIREQYPLSDLSEAIGTAERAGIRYPYDSKSGFPYVMTSDFYVETTSGAVVLSVKPSSELEKPRVLEKLEIERRYWAMRNVRWELVTELEISRVKARNIEWLSQASDLSVFGLCEAQQVCCTDFFMDQFITAPNDAAGLFRELEQRFGLSDGMGLNIYKHLAYHKRIDIDVSRPIDFAAFAIEPTKLTA